jgi:hypothetical protein
MKKKKSNRFAKENTNLPVESSYGDARILDTPDRSLPPRVHEVDVAFSIESGSRKILIKNIKIIHSQFWSSSNQGKMICIHARKRRKKILEV